MCLRITAILILVFSLSQVNAQLTDGSIGPDFSLSDIEGNTHNLYEILDEGKSVIIDFSATWCGNCWNYHNTNALDNVYDTYGPQGTDVTTVLWIEADANTSEECITDSPGCTGSSIGDWTAGSNHPYINLDSDNFNVKADYNINSFPTIIGIAPNRKQYNIGKLTNADTWDSWINETFALDYTVETGFTTIDLNVIAGYEEKTFLWNDGNTSQNRTNLSPGIYTCTITEGRGHSIETENIMVIGANTVFICPPTDDVVCSVDEIPVYSDLLNFIENDGIAAGEINDNTFSLADETITGTACPFVVTRVYSIKNFNGGTLLCEQSFTVEDIEAPVVTAVPDVIISATDIVNSQLTSLEDMANAGIEYSDNCTLTDESISLISESIEIDECTLIVRLYSLSDPCGNATTFNQLVYVEIDEDADITLNSQQTELDITVNADFDINFVNSILWEFGDGESSSGLVASHSYDASGTYELCLTINTNCGTITRCETIEVKSTVATKRTPNFPWAVQPIPAFDFLEITNAENDFFTNITIYNTQGEAIILKQTSPKTINISDLPTGIYFIQLSSEEGSKIVKFVKI